VLAGAILAVLLAAGGSLLWRHFTGLSCVSEVFVSNLDGSGERRLTAYANDADSPVWSPDGNSIAFVRRLGSDDAFDPSSVWVMGADGSNKRQLIRRVDPHAEAKVAPDGEILEAALQETSPVWSPDGRRIAFVRGRENNGQNGMDIYIADVASGISRRVTETTTYGRDDMLAWSPDGLRIAIVSWALSGLRILDLGTGQTRHLRHTYGSWLDPEAWSPDGSRLILTESVDEGAEANAVYVIDRVGGNQRLLWRLSGDEAYGAYALWSKFNRIVVGTADGIAIFRPDTAHPQMSARRIPSGWGELSPDGRRLAFTRVVRSNRCQTD